MSTMNAKANIGFKTAKCPLPLHLEVCPPRLFAFLEGSWIPEHVFSDACRRELLSQRSELAAIAIGLEPDFRTYVLGSSPARNLPRLDFY